MSVFPALHSCRHLSSSVLHHWHVVFHFEVAWGVQSSPKWLVWDFPPQGTHTFLGFPGVCWGLGSVFGATFLQGKGIGPQAQDAATDPWPQLTGDRRSKGAMIWSMRLIESFSLLGLGAVEVWTLGLWCRLISREPLTPGGTPQDKLLTLPSRQQVSLLPPQSGQQETEMSLAGKQTASQRQTWSGAKNL